MRLQLKSERDNDNHTRVFLLGSYEKNIHVHIRHFLLFLVLLARTTMSEAISDFFRHMGHMDHGIKSELSNVAQYAMIAMIPIILLNKIIYWYLPAVDERKDSWMLVLEILFQMIFMFWGMFMIHRFVIYFPTYSGESYGDFLMMPTILATLMIVFSLNTKIGEKAAVLTERLQQYWETGQIGGGGGGDEKDGRAGREGMQGRAAGVDAQQGGYSSAMAPRAPEPVMTTMHAPGAGLPTPGGAAMQHHLPAPGEMPMGGMLSLSSSHGFDF